MTLSLVINHAIESKNIKKLLITGTSGAKLQLYWRPIWELHSRIRGRKLLIDCDLRKPDFMRDWDSNSVEHYLDRDENEFGNV